jgi:hypothetical protein
LKERRLQTDPPLALAAEFARTVFLFPNQLVSLPLIRIERSKVSTVKMTFAAATFGEKSSHELDALSLSWSWLQPGVSTLVMSGDADDFDDEDEEFEDEDDDFEDEEEFDDEEEEFEEEEEEAEEEFEEDEELEDDWEEVEGDEEEEEGEEEEEEDWDDDEDDWDDDDEDEDEDEDWD